MNIRNTNVSQSHHQELNTGLKLLFFSKGTEYDSPQIYATPRPDQSAEIAEFGTGHLLLWRICDGGACTPPHAHTPLPRLGCILGCTTQLPTRVWWLVAQAISGWHAFLLSAYRRHTQAHSGLRTQDSGLRTQDSHYITGVYYTVLFRWFK